MFNRRRIPLVVAGACVLMLAAGAAAAPNALTASLTPAHVKPSTSASYTLVVTSAATSDQAEKAKVAIPTGFPDPTGVTATTTAAANCNASTWVADGTLIAGGAINLKRPSGGGNSNLCAGATLTVAFTAVSPAAPGPYTWTPQLYSVVDGQPFGAFTGNATVDVDGTAPDTTITSAPPANTNSASAQFSFSASEAGTFECRLDADAFAACTSPQSYQALGAGVHTFEVRAVDLAGNVDGSPASHTWTIDFTGPDTAITTGPAPITNETAATFTFTSSDAGSTFQCRLDAAAFAACTSPQSYQGLAAGGHTFEVRAIDPVGNIDGSPASQTWTIDTTPPTTTITSGPSASTNQTSATFAFSSSEAGSTFQCHLDGAAFTACTSPQTYPGLGGGSHTFEVRSIDQAGNVDASPASRTWTVDVTAPNTSIATGPPSITNQTSATFTFTSTEAGSSFQCRLDTAAFAPCTSPQSYTALAAGSHTFAVRAVDAVGNVDGSPASQTWTIDTTTPATTITSGPSAPTNQTTATFAFSSSEAGSTFQCHLDGAAFTACTSPQTYPGLGGGSHTFEVRAIDQAGNVDASPASRTWTIDVAAPNTSIGTGPPSITNQTSATFTFTSTEAGSTFQCRLDTAAFAACTSPHGYQSLGAGSHTFEVRAIDAVGNVDGTPASQSWTIDTTAPSVNITQMPSDPSDVKSPTFQFTVGDAGTITGVQCQLDAAAFLACTSPKSYPDLADGQHTFTVRATDAAGNTGQSQYAWRLETIRPVATLTDKPASVSTSTSARFEFTSRPQTTFECTLDGVTDAACASPKAYSGLSQGPHTFSVIAKDGTGSGPPTSYGWTIDSVGPSVAITQRPGDPTSSRSATFVFAANEAASFSCQLDGGGFGPCSSPASYQGLGDGGHTFTVRATDVLGNAGAPASSGWRVDATAPETTFVAHPAARTSATAATFSFSANEPATFQCKLDTAAFAPCTSPKALTGQRRTAHVFEVRAVDGVGNVDASPAVYRWTVVPATTRRATAASALLAPPRGARLTSPPLLRWRPVARTSFYNVQLFRGSVKILSAWPTRTRLQLRARWLYLGRERRLKTGTYRWYVWPAFGKGSSRRYGRLLGQSTFTMRAGARR